MVTYKYDAWGKHKVYDSSNAENTSSSFIGNINPFRYKGYYYYVETEWYYLESRYYSPLLSRFISNDNVQYIEPWNIAGINLFSYCGNSPVSRIDSSSTKWYESLLSFSHFFDLAVVGTQLIILGGLLSSYLAVANAIRPNNIGIGYWEKEQVKALEGIKSDANNVGKFSKVLAIIAIAIQVTERVVYDYKRGYSTDRIESNAVVNTVIFSITTIGLGMIGSKIGGVLGTLIPVPIVGTMIGMGLGFVIGVGVGMLLELKFDDKSIIDHIDDAVYNFWNKLFK